MQTKRPAGGGAVFGQLILRWGFALLGVGAGWFAIDRMTEWSQELAIRFEPDFGLWIQGTFAFLLAGLFFGGALWLPVPGRGIRASVLFGMALPVLLVTIFYAVIFQMDFGDLPDFIANRLLRHPLFSLFAVSFAPLLLGLSVIAAFCPAGHVPLNRLAVPQGYAQSYAPSSGPPPATAPPPPQAGPAEPADRQQTREMRPGDR